MIQTWYKKASAAQSEAKPECSKKVDKWVSIRKPHFCEACKEAFQTDSKMRNLTVSISGPKGKRYRNFHFCQRCGTDANIQSAFDHVKKSCESGGY